MCKNYSACFIVIIIFAYVGLFTITLLNMIFSIKTYKSDVFQYRTVEKYQETLDATFIMDLEFGENIDMNDIFGEYSRDPISKWRNTSMKFQKKAFKIEILKDIIWREENCAFGYKKCGLVNSNDSLCLKLGENEACPINHILIDSSEEYNNYKSFKLGDKYIHYSNEEIDNYLLEKFNITDELLDTTLDEDTFHNLCEYNPEIWHYYRGNAYLNGEYYFLQNKENFKQLIENYNKITKMYNQNKINDMNKKIENKAIMSLGIVIFVLTVFIIIDIGIYFPLEGTDLEECLKGSKISDPNPCAICFGFLFLGLCFCFFRYSCEICLGIERNQKRLSIVFFFIFLPELILALISMGFALYKKIKIDDYLSMEYIELFIKNDVKSVQDNLDRVIILIIINIAIFVLYPILILIANKLKGDDDYYTVKNNIETSLHEFNK